MTNGKVVTRFAPSPTGYFHAGSYRTALFSWIYARQNNGIFILRIEDTDRERSKKEYGDNIIESLKWLGLDYDMFYRQSERTDIYKKYIKRLIDSGHAYISSEEKNGDKVFADRRSAVIRFKNPNKKVTWNDLIRGRIEFDTTELGDFVIAKSEDEPVFHLVVVVDDIEMEISHIIRGEDHISNTPRQILIYEALGAGLPQYAHIPLLLAGDRSKLSKRAGAVAINEYRDRGYIPEAMVNYMAMLGWHPSDEREIMSIEDITKAFSLERVQKSGAIFDEEKLTWFNRQYIIKMSDDEFAGYSTAFLPDWITTKSPIFKRLIPLLREKIENFKDIETLLEKGGELAFVKQSASYNPELLLWKKNPDIASTRLHLEKCLEILGDLKEENFSAEEIKSAIWPYAEEKGRGDVLWPLRTAVTGQEKSPDPFVSSAILGKEETLNRIKTAIEHCK